MTKKKSNTESETQDVAATKLEAIVRRCEDLTEQLKDTRVSKTTNSWGWSTNLPELLTVSFVVLKLTGYINWSWLWVLAPLWVSTSVVLVLGIILLAVMWHTTNDDIEEN